MYLILQGTVYAVYKGHPVLEFGPNEHFGHFCLFEHLSRYDYRCTEPTICLFISKTELENTLMCSSKVEYNSTVNLAKKDIAGIDNCRCKVMKFFGQKSTPEKSPNLGTPDKNKLSYLSKEDSPISGEKSGGKLAFVNKTKLAIELKPIVEPEPEHHILITPTPTSKMVADYRYRPGMEGSPVLFERFEVQDNFRMADSPESLYKKADGGFTPGEPLFTLENHEEEDPRGEHHGEEDESQDSALQDSMDRSGLADIFNNDWVSSGYA